MANLYLIRELCDRKKITLRELSRRVGRDESSIQSSIRRGSTSTATIEAIAKELGVSPAVFFTEYSPEEARDLRKENAYLKELLNEKERLIEVLMGNRKE